MIFTFRCLNFSMHLLLAVLCIHTTICVLTLGMKNLSVTYSTGYFFATQLLVSAKTQSMFCFGFCD